VIVDVYEAIDRMLWALLAWIAVFAAVGTLLLLAVAAAVAWAWRALRPSRGHRAAPDAPHAPNGGREPRGLRKPSGDRTGPRAPSCAHSQPLDYEEAS
jgi:hypothetical protein